MLGDFQALNQDILNPQDSKKVGLLDRPRHAIENLVVEQNLPAVWRSLFQPQELTPSEKNVLMKKWGLDKGPWASAFETITNPVLLLSLALSYKFPVPTGANVLKVSRKVESLAARIPGLRHLSSMQGLFLGVKRKGSTADFVDEFGEIVRNTNDFRSKFGSRMAEFLQKYEARTGGLPSNRDQVMMAAWLDGLHKPLRGFQGKNGLVRVGSGNTTATLRGVGTLVPDLEQKMSPALLDLSKDMRRGLDEMWSDVFGDIKHRSRILETIRKQRGKGLGDPTLDVMEEFIKNPKKIPDYFPRRLLQSEEDFRQLIHMMTNESTIAKQGRKSVRRAQTWTSPEVYKRKFQMAPSRQDLSLISDLVDDGALSRMDEITKARIINRAGKEGVRESTIRSMRQMSLKDLEENYAQTFQPGEAEVIARGMVDVRPREYDLKAMPVLSQYTHTLAGTYAWTAKGGGKKVVGMLEDLDEKALRGDTVSKYQANLLRDTYLPVAMGRGNLKNSLRAQMWAQSTQKLKVWAENNPTIKKILGPSLHKTIMGGVESSVGSFSLRNMERKAAAYFYLTTLGGNPGSALKNLLQLVLTTGPVIGYATAAQGTAEAVRKSHKYFALRLGPRKHTHEQALREAYPDFAEAGLVASPITEEVVENTLRNAHDIAALPTGKAVRTADKIQRAMMSMFQASETTVRLGTFEGAMIHARRARMPKKEAIEFSRRIVEKTQFMTGPQNTPYFLIDRSPLIRQLGQFPMRMLEFSITTALTAGSGAIDPRTGKEMNVMGFNPGTFARMVAGSVLALELGEQAGLDMSDALLGGALPGFQPAGKILAPLPVVPPFLQVTGSVAAGLGSGDFTEALRSTPLVVPGGSQLFRMMGLLPPGVPGAELGQRAAKTFERTYADYEQPAPDGRVAVYSGSGTFRGYYTPWELTKAGLGIRGGDLSLEQELLQTLVKNRDQIREHRRGYLDARISNDPARAANIARDFQQRFGLPLPVAPQHLRAAQLRRTLSRLEQVIRTFPEGDARDQAVNLMAITLGTEGEKLLGIDPQLLGEDKKVRDRSRWSPPRRRGISHSLGGPPQGASGRTRFLPQQDLSPMNEINPSTIGRTPGVNQVGPPF